MWDANLTFQPWNLALKFNLEIESWNLNLEIPAWNSGLKFNLELSTLKFRVETQPWISSLKFKIRLKVAISRLKFQDSTLTVRNLVIVQRYHPLGGFSHFWAPPRIPGKSMKTHVFLQCHCGRFLIQLGIILPVKSTQEPSKTPSQVASCFRSSLGPIVMVFYSYSSPKSIKNPSKSRPNNTTTKKWHSWFRLGRADEIVPSAMLCWVQISEKIERNTFRTQLSNQHPHLDRFLNQLLASFKSNFSLFFHRFFDHYL